MERRTNTRYRLGARAVFSWEGAEKNLLQGEGVTRDISLSSAFILSLTCPPVEAEVEVELFLPPFHGTVATARIKAKARVLRVEQAPEGEQQSGFAVDSPGFKFLFAGESNPESASGPGQGPKDSERSSD